ncbi:D-cysteine desulfhydrase [Desulfovibrio litoralis]|uniref:D-cysteine desulfhydrase n=1 Tax=Desulfovibrio litoralis DSM 11393 TaxID=1121455 RepID=A0A1M7SN14_9BACT|nr:D-cysteine desulfhydrase [Desulfovibrio litoralis]SHN59831.1 D-cysteine desulfhydrase [Desulfovibrio litoralis DSM 11393]
MNFTNFPRKQFLQGATPLEAMPNLSKALGGRVNLYIKRDDLLPGAAGGNKTRKLEFSFGEALSLGADTIITCGAVQSNHARLTASWAAKENLECHLILEERVKGSYKPNASGNNLLFHLLGVKSIRVVPGGSNMMAEMEKTAEDLKKQGKKPYIVPGGASNPVGALGYVASVSEILQQLNSMQLKIDSYVVPSGSAGTHAGTVVGMFGENGNIPVIGINVSRPKDVQEDIVYNLANATAKLLNLKTELPKGNIECFADYFAPGYSLPNDGMVEAVKLFSKHEAILLDPVYSGKAAAGLIDLVRKGHFKEGSSILFLHTGGSPVLYAYLDSLL